MKTDQNRHHKGVFGAALAQLGGFLRAGFIGRAESSAKESDLGSPTELADVIAYYLGQKNIPMATAETAEPLGLTVRLRAAGLKKSPKNQLGTKLTLICGVKNMPKAHVASARALAMQVFGLVEKAVRNASCLPETDNLRLYQLKLSFGLKDGKVVLLGPIAFSDMHVVHEVKDEDKSSNFYNEQALLKSLIRFVGAHNMTQAAFAA